MLLPEREVESDIITVEDTFNQGKRGYSSNLGKWDQCKSTVRLVWKWWAKESVSVLYNSMTFKNNVLNLWHREQSFFRSGERWLPLLVVLKMALSMVQHQCAEEQELTFSRCPPDHKV